MILITTLAISWLTLLASAIFAVRSRGARTAIGWEVVGRLLSVGLVFYWYLEGMLVFGKLFDDFDVQLPGLVKLMLHSAGNRLVLVPSLTLFAVSVLGEVGLFTSWRLMPETEKYAKFLSLVTTFLTTVPVLFGVGSLGYAFVQLLRSLG